MSKFRPGQLLSFADIMAMRSSQKASEAKDAGKKKAKAKAPAKQVEQEAPTDG